MHALLIHSAWFLDGRASILVSHDFLLILLVKIIVVNFQIKEQVVELILCLVYQLVQRNGIDPVHFITTLLSTIIWKIFVIK